MHLKYTDSRIGVNRLLRPFPIDYHVSIWEIKITAAADETGAPPSEMKKLISDD